MKYKINKNSKITKSINRSLMNCDILSDSDYIYIFIDLPGYNKDDIKINIEDNYLTIYCERNKDYDDSLSIIHAERFFGTFYRKFYMNSGGKENIKASLKDGVLNIVIKKVISVC